MPINPEAVGTKGNPVKRSWGSKDALLYAVGVGAGLDELQYTTENTKDVAQKVLPTFAVIVGGGGIPMDKVGTFNPMLMVPADGEIESVGEVTGIYDKGSAALLEFSSESKDVKTGKLLVRTTTTLFCRGEGGWGGDRGPADKLEFPEAAADHQVTYKTREDQALTYRLSGDRNPLHSDPSFAAMGGFEKPILHGLCTYGFTGRALLHTLCNGEASKFKSMSAKFSKPVMPGDELTISMWVDGNTALFKTMNQDGQIVINDGKFIFG